MNRLAGLMMVAMLASGSGCAVGTTPYDYAYAAYGGIRERQNMYSGRVGSLVDPAPAAGVPVLVSAGRPLPTLGPSAPPDAAEDDGDLGPTAPPPDTIPPTDVPSETGGRDLPDLPDDLQLPFEPDDAILDDELLDRDLPGDDLFDFPDLQ